MKLLSEQSLELADAFEEKWHKFYPDGQTVSPYSNHDVPGTCYLDGFAACEPLARADQTRVILELLRSEEARNQSNAWIKDVEIFGSNPAKAHHYANWLEAKLREGGK